MKPPTLKDGLLALLYALKAGAVFYAIHLTHASGLSSPMVPGLLIPGAAVPDILVLAALISGAGGGKVLKSVRRIAAGAEMAAAASLFLLGSFHAVRGERGDEIGLGYWVLAVPFFLLALPDLIPFDAEKEGPL